MADHCYDFIADCGLRASLDLFAHTWDPIVLAALADGPRRRGDLRSAIGGISDKVLTEALRRLLARGLLQRQARAGAPPSVEYSLTPLGDSLVDGPIRALAAWTRDHAVELGDDTALPALSARRAAGRRG